jgi:hypothetical protein
MNNAVATLTNARAILSSVVRGDSLTFNVGKSQKSGTFALAIAFASRDSRAQMGQTLYAKWLATGQFRPIVNDILACGLVPKTALPYVQGLSGVTESGPVSRENFVRLCAAVKAQVDAKEASGKGIPKGQKGFVYEIVSRVATGAAPATFDTTSRELSVTETGFSAV